MKHPLVLFFVVVSGISVASSAQTASPTSSAIFPGAEWAHTQPAAVGWDLGRMKLVDSYAKEMGSHGCHAAIQHGVIVVQGGDVAARTESHSCRKSFLSALIGNAVARNQVHLDDTLASLGLDDNPPSLTPEEKQAYREDVVAGPQWCISCGALRNQQHGREPGLSAAAIRRALSGTTTIGTSTRLVPSMKSVMQGRSIFESMEQEIARPIGMVTFGAATVAMCVAASLVSSPILCSCRLVILLASPCCIFTAETGRVHSLFRLSGSQESTHSWSNTESGGYGYLWWTGDPATPDHHPEYVFPPGSFWLEGHLGQYAVVVPSDDLIVVVRVEGDHPKKQVHKGEMAKFVRLVVEATDH